MVEEYGIQCVFCYLLSIDISFVLIFNVNFDHVLCIMLTFPCVISCKFSWENLQIVLFFIAVFSHGY